MHQPTFDWLSSNALPILWLICLLMSYLRYGSTPPIRNMIQKHRIQQELNKMSNGRILNKRLNMTVKSQQQQKISFNWQYSSLPVLLSQWESSIKFLLELALAEQDSKFIMPEAFFLFFNSLPKWLSVVPGVASGDRGNWGKNRDNFRCMQISLVMSRFIFSDDWNDTCKLITFFAVWQWCVIMHVY